MCAIAGVSFSPESKINRRRLTSELLKEAQVRGRDASGYAWVQGDQDGVFKRDIPGSQLSTRHIPSRADSIIIHTRAATHGSPKDNRNNHPVLSPSGNIRLVHNGVLYNHDLVRSLLGDDGKGLPPVDTSVLPAVIDILGLENTDIIEGDAAAAWFDRSSGPVIHLARFNHSPVVFAELEDGSIAFASTADILGAALSTLGIRWYGAHPGPMDKMDQGEYFQLLEGEIILDSEVEWGDDYSFGGASDWRSVTSGASTSKGHTVRRAWEEDDGYFDANDTSADAYFGDGRAAVMGSEDSDPSTLPLFWLELHDNGDRTEFNHLPALLGALSWYTGLKGGVYEMVTEEEDETSWINHIGDIGEISLEDGEYISWVSKPNEMSDYGDSIPSWLRDGITVLRQVMV